MNLRDTEKGRRRPNRQAVGRLEILLLLLAALVVGGVLSWLVGSFLIGYGVLAIAAALILLIFWVLGSRRRFRRPRQVEHAGNEAHAHR